MKLMNLNYGLSLMNLFVNNHYLVINLTCLSFKTHVLHHSNSVVIQKSNCNFICHIDNRTQYDMQ